MNAMKKERESYKRVMRALDLSEEEQDSLIESGYVSPLNIVKRTQAGFIDEAKRNIGMEPEEAKALYQKADKISRKALQLYMNLKTTLGSDFYMALKGNSITDEFKNEFEEMVNYQQLFGSLDHREGEEWESIFGPAAYFVDLVRITDRYITGVCKDIPKGYTLGERRPDLEQIVLDKKNTEELVPYLKIVNERLRDAVKTWLDTDDPERALSEMSYPLGLPVNLPLEDIRLLLRQKHTSLEQIYRVLTADGEAAAAEALSLTKDELSSVAVRIPEEELAAAYGLKPKELAKLGRTGFFQWTTELDPADLRALLNQDLRPEEETLASGFYINGELPDGEYVRESEGKLLFLTDAALNRINRFLRLGRMLSLSLEETDWLIACLSETGEIDEAFCHRVATAVSAYRRMKFPFYDFMSLLGPMKTYGENSLFDQVFKQDGFSYHPKHVKNPLYQDPVLLWNDGNDAQIVNWLCASLRIKADELKGLKAFLFPEKEVELSVENLSELYRHVRLAGYLNMDLVQYLVFRSLHQEEVAVNEEQVLRYLQDRDQLERSGISVYEADFICRGTVSPYVSLKFTDTSLHDFLAYTGHLTGENVEEEIPRETASFLASDEETVRALFTLLARCEGAVNPAELFRHPLDKEEKIKQMFLVMNRLLLLIEKGISTDILVHVQENEDRFGIADVCAITLTELFSLCDFAAFLKDAGDTSHELLGCTELLEKDFPQLCAVTLWNEDMVREIAAGYLTKDMTVTERLSTLKGILGLLNSLKVNLAFLEELAGVRILSVSDYDKAEEIRKKAAAALVVNLPKQAMDARELKIRDCYLSIVCHKTGLKKTEVYKYLLIDPEMSEKNQITVLREAMNAVQLYLKRCHMGLEKGVKDLEIDENWWSWIMDYNLWRANREIFIYPENYVVPSLRHTKTSLFKNVESSLLQSAVDKNYLETLYAQYFEDFSNLAEIDICGALKADKELYLFGRTKKQPYTTYYCTARNGQAFTEWNKIESNINAKYITPVCAGGRIFLFWAQLQKDSKVTLNGNNSTEHNTYRVTIRYIYRNAGKKWSTPQEFIKDEIVYYEEDGKNYLEGCSLFDGLFDMTDPVWEKVVVIPVKGKNYRPFMEREDTLERLCVFYGPLLNQATEDVDTDMLRIELSDRDGQEFLQKMDETAEHYRNLLSEGQMGQICAGFSKVFNLNFQSSSLIRENEFLVFDEYAPMLHSDIRSPQISLSGHSLGVTASPYPIRDTYWENSLRLKSGTAVTVSETSFLCPKYGIDEKKSNEIYQLLKKALVINTMERGKLPQVDQEVLNHFDLKEELMEKAGLLDHILQIEHVRYVLYDCMENRILFEAGIDGNTKLFPIYNQPGDFIVDTGEETFLFQPEKSDKTAPYQSFGDGITVSYPLVSVATLKKNGRFADRAGEIMQKLRLAGLLDEKQMIRADACTVEAVNELFGDEEDAAALYSILQNDPLADPSFFIDTQTAIDGRLSQKLYDRFRKEGYILDGRVCVYRVYESYSLSDLVGEVLDAGERTAGRVSEIVDSIYQRLSTAPVPVSIQYWTAGNIAEDELSYRLVRLSTGAVQRLKNRLEENGIKTLLDMETQNIPVLPVLPFDRFEAGKEASIEELPAKDGTGVDFRGLYGEYYWEMFYHIPMLIAQNRKDGGKNEECRRWQEYVFSPTNQKEAIHKNTFYQKAPNLFNMQRSEQVYKLLLSNNVVDPLGVVDPKYDRKLAFLTGLLADKTVKAVRNILDNAVLIPENAYFWNFFPFRQHNPEEVHEMLSDKSEAMIVYQDDPFDPHGVARLRIGAYEKYTIMQYVENIIAWGDREFVRDSWESFTLASMYYITAYELLGPKPVRLGARPKKEPVTFRQIKEQYEEIPPFLIEIAGKLDNTEDDPNQPDSVPFTDVSLYFGIPENEMLTRLWELVEDRLYKLRNCLDINGNARYLETYGQRIDPMMLAKAVSSAQNSPAVLDAPAVTRYPYRFSFLVEQAKNLAGRLAAVGSQMLNISEKRDAEELALTSSNNERMLSDMLTTVKELQIAEMEKGLEGLKSSYEGSKKRHDYYNGLLEKGLSEGETESLTASDTAFALTTAANVMKMAASAAHALPQIGSPFAMTYGGVQVGATLDGTASVMELGGGIASFISGRSATMAGYERRRQEWEFQKENASFEMDGIRYQIESCEDKIAQAKRDLEIHQASIEQKDRMISYLKTKFTGTELYQWMQGRLNTVLWQTYNQAMELALQAQEAYREERDSKESFIVFEYWDNAKKGLLAGENLLTELEQMQIAYFKKNERKLEIEKHISLARCCPKAFWDLKKTGKCSFDFTETMFDYDYPGCYARKIVSISLSIPALLGPYQNIKAILKQTGMHKTVTAPDKDGVIYLLSGQGRNVPDSVRIRNAGNQCIAISGGIDDSGMFALNFGDDRYLPFEGAGVVSSWELSMPKNTNRFDFESITDIIVHVRYQALFQEGLKTEVEKELAKYPVDGSLYYSLAHAKRKEWNQFVEGAGEDGWRSLSFDLSPEYGYLRDKRIKAVYLKLHSQEGRMPDDGTELTMEFPDQKLRTVDVKNDMGEVILNEPMEKLVGKWKIRYKGTASLMDIELLLVYQGCFGEVGGEG